MKHSILLFFIVLPLLVLNGCSSLLHNTGSEMEKGIETVSQTKEELDLIGLSYYYHHGSMAGMDYNYEISKDPNGTFCFYASLESGNRTVNKKISQEEFDAIIQMANENYIAETEADDLGDEYVALDAGSSGFEAIFADDQTKAIDFGQANSEIITQFEKLLGDQ